MKLRFIFYIIITFALLAACGGKKESSSSTENTVINLTASDQMQYNLKTIEVKAGSTVRVNLKHIGQMAKTIMGHNFVLLKADADLSGFAAAAISAKDTDYIPKSKEDQVIAHTNMIGGGESTFVEFTAPQAGTYKFLCTFPGHYVTMQGDFIVK